MSKKMAVTKVLICFSAIILIFIIFSFDIEIPTVFPTNQQIIKPESLTIIFIIIIVITGVLIGILALVRIYEKHKEVKEFEET